MLMGIQWQQPNVKSTKGPNTITTPNLEKAQKIIDKNPRKSMKAIANDLKVSECIIRRVVNEDIWYKSRVMWKGQFMLEETRENHLICEKHLLNKLKTKRLERGNVKEVTQHLPCKTIKSLKSAITSTMYKDHLIQACQQTQSNYRC